LLEKRVRISSTCLENSQPGANWPRGLPQKEAAVSGGFLISATD
jgi:hypothetical protein